MLEREEYVEQTYFFRVLAERLPHNEPLQNILAQVRDELLATTKLPLAIDYLLTELNHSGMVSLAMARLPHYFTPFQTYIFQEAENERGRFDIRIAVAVLRHEAKYRADGATRQGLFLYQFEVLCRNRLRYDHGLQSVANDPIYDELWSKWILQLRRKIGIVEFADMVYVVSEHYSQQQARRGKPENEGDHPALFGEKEGRIALANRRKDPLYFFSALQRQLGYPAVPRHEKGANTAELVPQMVRRMERLETRLKLLEEEQRQSGIDLTRFYDSND